MHIIKNIFLLTIFQLKYISLNWKFLIHVVFGTYRFGVDNHWKSNFDSMFGISVKDRFSIKEIILRYKAARARAFCGFIPIEDAVRLFPLYARRNGYDKISKLEKEINLN